MIPGAGLGGFQRGPNAYAKPDGVKITIRIFGHGDQDAIFLGQQPGQSIDPNSANAIFGGLKQLGVVEIYIRACDRSKDNLDPQSQEKSDSVRKALYDLIAKLSGAHVKGFLGPDFGNQEATAPEQRTGFYDPNGDSSTSTSTNVVHLTRPPLD